nr:hypothetical protein [Tanacetum cinerariifolium]
MFAVRDITEEAEAQVPAQGDDVHEHAAEEVATDDDEVKGRHADKQAEIYSIDLDHSSKVLSMQEDDTEKDQVEMDAEYAKKLQEELDKEHEESYKNIDWNASLDLVQSKEPQYIKIYHRIKKKPQSKSEVRKNMISYLKNTEGYKMEFFKGKTYD